MIKTNISSQTPDISSDKFNIKTTRKLFKAIENNNETLATKIFETGKCDLLQVNNEGDNEGDNALMFAIWRNMEPLATKIFETGECDLTHVVVTEIML